MRLARYISVAWMALALVAAAALAQPKPPADGATPILDTSGFWRFHLTMAMPVVRQGDSVKPVPEAFADDWVFLQGDRFARWLMLDTPTPPASWATPDFDDHAWLRMPGQPLHKTYRNKRGFGYESSPYMKLLCMRGRFRVDDPARAAGLALSIEYSGGVVVRVNGKELCRANLPAGNVLPDTLADDYAAGSVRTRSLSGVAVPAALLRKGVNVLAVEVHRAPFAASDYACSRRDNWRRVFTLAPATCAIESIRLHAPAGSSVVPNVARPAGLQVWNSDPLSPDFDLDYGDANEPLRPVEIVATPNGAFSGKVVLGSDSPIRVLRASVSDLAHADKTHRIPASAVQIRYASPALVASVEGSIDFVHFYGGTEAGAEARYLAEPGRFDGLNEVPPDEVPVYEKKPAKGSLVSVGLAPSCGAVVPVWLTVHVPADAAPGEYRGTLALKTAGAADVAVPVRLRVSAWPLPDPKDFRTFVELVQSPESVALYYGVPFWSDAHFKYLERSLSLVGQIGSRTAYVPLICETNLGNSESMVRWIKQPDGSFSWDFAALDRYLDLLGKCQPNPQVVCFVVWDIFLPSTGRQGWGPHDYKGGPEVTLLDPASAQVSKHKLPAYDDPAAAGLWKPLLAEIRARMKKRGFESAMMLGCVTDRWPDKPIIKFFEDLLPGIPWVSISHLFPGKNVSIPFGYQANVLDESNVLDPSVSRLYGWKKKDLVRGVHFPRMTQDIFPLATFRFLCEMEVARGYRGVARLGADPWPVLKDRRGNRVGRVEARYPKSAWWNLNIITSLLAPGPDGAIATVRYETLRQGIQECEARAFIEQALADKASRDRLGAALAGRCQDLLDRRTRDMLRAVNNLVQTDDSWADYTPGWWMSPGIIGSQWYLTTDWQQRTAELFDAAAEVAKTLHEKQEEKTT